MKKRYETFAHAKTHIRYHIIFSTKYRKECLSGLESEVKEIFMGISDKSKFSILSIGIDKNHLHLFVKSCPTMSIYRIVQRLKSMSTYLLWQSHGEHLRRFYWGKKKHLWTGGYFCSTVGEMSEETVEHYIAKQG